MKDTNLHSTNGPAPAEASTDAPLRGGHPYHMYDNLQVTASVLARCLEPGEISRMRAAAGEIARRGIEKVFFTGCGTSLNEGKTLVYCMERIAGLPAKAVDSLEFQRFPPPDLNEKSCVIAISHSGNTLVTCQAAGFAGQQGAFTLTMVGRPDGRLGRMGDLTLFDPGGREFNGPKVRSYIVTCFQGLLLSLALREIRTGTEEISALAGLPERFGAFLQQVEPLAQAAAREWAAAVKAYMVAGAGCDAGNAFEMALKLMETIYEPASGYEIEELTHGPLYSLAPDRGVILLDSGPEGRARCLEAAHAVRSVTRHVLVVTAEPEAPWPEEAVIIPLPSGLGEAAFLFSPLPVQVFIYNLCLALGTHPDQATAGRPAIREMRSRLFPPGTH